LVWRRRNAASAAGIYWRRCQLDLSQLAGAPAEFDRRRQKSFGGEAEGSIYISKNP